MNSLQVRRLAGLLLILVGVVLLVRRPTTAPAQQRVAAAG